VQPLTESKLSPKEFLIPGVRHKAIELNPSLDAALSRPKNGCCYTVSQLFYYGPTHHRASVLTSFGIVLGCVLALLGLMYLINFLAL
jgi:hypothetical protein